MPTIPYKAKTNISSMRKMALGTWRMPKDPSVNVQLDINITKLSNQLGSNLNKYLKQKIIQSFSQILNEVPELNTIILRGKFRQRTNNRIFIPTVFRHKQHLDLNGVFIDNAYKMSLKDIKSDWNKRINDLRSGNNQEIKKVITLFKFLPSIFCKPLIKLIGFIQYECNVSLSFLGLPKDPFGSMTITFLDKFDVKYADIPIFSFSRSAILIAVGAHYKVGSETFLPLTCTFDHRCFDGLEGNVAYKKLKKYMNQYENDSSDIP
jgi:pyruvate dehydrogenase E2 component (dihydrolipoamide acetyltransferase)